MKPRRALFISNLFPSSTEPGRGRFNLDLLRALRDAGLDFVVVAPRPWFPGWRTRSTAAGPRPPAREDLDGFRVVHPRALYLPLSRGALNGTLYQWSVARACLDEARDLAPDLVWASFAFPDAVGSAGVARRLDLPLVVSVHGSDVNLSFAMPGRRSAMLRCFEQAVVVFAKSGKMRDVLAEGGVLADKVAVVYNGVDRTAFHPRPRQEACRQLGIDPAQQRALFVGNLVPVKGLFDLLEAIRRLSGRGRHLEFVIAGEGPLEGALKSRAAQDGSAVAVRFVGRQSRERVALWMAAASALVLPSHSEGVPNVVLESLASGCPVVATAVGGVAEVHPGDVAGRLVRPGDVEALAHAIEDVLRREWDPERLRATVDRFTWPAAAQRTLEVLRGPFSDRTRVRD